MNGNANTGAFRVSSAGHLAYAALFVWLGALSFTTGGFTAIWSGVPHGPAWRQALVYFTAAICLGCGLALLWRRTATAAAGALAGYFTLWILVFRLPLLVQAPLTTPPWWVCGETSVMLAGAWVLLVTLGGGPRGGFATSAAGLRAAQVLYGLALIPFGIAHFTFFAHTIEDVPHWVPWPAAFAALTGGAFIAAGVAILTGVLASLAAALSAWMMGLFTLLVWVPIVIRGNPSPGDWQEFVDSCALTIAAWVVAESWRGASRIAAVVRRPQPMSSAVEST